MSELPEKDIPNVVVSLAYFHKKLSWFVSELPEKDFKGCQQRLFSDINHDSLYGSLTSTFNMSFREKSISFYGTTYQRDQQN